jgi:Holliday junction resolvasome RuvABC endonuclease subunit
VQQMVASLLHLADTLASPLSSEDASDALAIAICHATHVPFLALEARA